MSSGGDRIGVVLAGGGARGAYEVGALSVLLPKLAADGEQVSVIVGTSVGALNGAWLASKIHLPVEQLVSQYRDMWLGLRWEDVLARVWSLRSFAPLIRYGVEVVGGHARIDSLLDSRPLARTVADRLDTAQLQKNVHTGRLHCAAVVATAARSGDSVVFHSGGGHVKHDGFRGIAYAPASLAHEHVLASAAIPCAFRPVRVSSPSSAQGWYVDGGTRLNTPIKPALALGADQIIVVGLNTTRAGKTDTTKERTPDVFQGAGQLTQAILADPLAHDVRTLAMINAAASAGHDPHHRVVPYILVEPKVRNRIGEIASQVYAEHYASARGLRSSVGALGRLVRADASPANGELLSYLFFAPEFAERLLEEGAADARRWLSRHHDDGIWQRGPADRAPQRRSSAVSESATPERSL
jgi:NTE family protein